MAESKDLLDQGDIDQIVDSVVVMRDVFTPTGESREVQYNYLKITLINGDNIRCKLDRVSKSSIWLAKQAVQQK